MFSLGNQAVWRGDYTEAKEQLVNSLVTRQKLGDYTEIASTLNSLGEVARSQGDYEGADKYYGEAIKIWRKIGNRMGLLTSLGNLAWVSLDSGEYHKAKVLFNESFTLSNEDGDKYGLIYCLAGFAGILGMIGKPEQAACLLSASVHLLKGSNRPLDPPDQKDLDRYIAAVRGQLNEGVFVNAWALGSEMTLEQAIAFALAETIV